MRCTDAMQVQVNLWNGRCILIRIRSSWKNSHTHKQPLVAVQKFYSYELSCEFFYELLYEFLF